MTVTGGSASDDCAADGAVYRVGLYSGKASAQSRGELAAGNTLVVPGYCRDSDATEISTAARTGEPFLDALSAVLPAAAADFPDSSSASSSASVPAQKLEV